jgi:hypothetical protein
MLLLQDRETFQIMGDDDSGPPRWCRLGMEVAVSPSRANAEYMLSKTTENHGIRMSVCKIRPGLDAGCGLAGIYWNHASVKPCVHVADASRKRTGIRRMRGPR